MRAKTLLVVNNEYTNRKIIWGNREEGKAANDDDIAKGKNAHGISVVEIAFEDGKWHMVKDSPYNRRITPDSEMALTGPASGHDLLKNRSGRHRHQVPWHMEQLRQRRDPLGHLSRM